MNAQSRILAPDEATVRQFLEIVHTAAAHAFESVERPGYLQLVRIHPASEDTVAQRFQIGDVDGMTRAAVADARNGHNVYVEGRTVAETATGRGKLADTRGVFALVIDSDADKGMAGTVKANPSMVVETSPGNAHLWHLLDRAVPAEEARALGEAMRKATGADADTGVITQPYRVAGTPNYPGPKKQERGRVATPTRIAQHLGTRWSASDLRDVFPAQPKEAPNSTSAPGHASIEVTMLVAETATEEMDRSARFQSVVNAAKRAGMTPDSLEALMRKHPQGCAGKYLENRDRLGEEIDRSWSKGSQPLNGEARPGHQVPQPIALRWHGEADPNADRSWLVRNLIPETGKGLLSGQWGTAKTFGALDLSASVMTLEPFAGRPVARQGGVLFIAPEGAYEIPIRLRGLVEGKLSGLLFSRLANGGKAVDPKRLPIAWIDECPPLVGKDAVATLAMTARAVAERLERDFGLPLALIVIDTVAASSGVTDENASAENHRVMNALESLSKQTGAFVLGVDHFGKMVETGTRGSSAKEAAADVVLAMLADRDITGALSNTRMAVRKLRGGATGAETPYSLEVVSLGEDKDGEPVTTCIVKWALERSSEAPAATHRERWPTSLKVFQKAMQVALTEHGKRLRPFGMEGPEVLAAAEAKVRAEFVAAYPIDGETSEKRSEAKRKAFVRALKAAVERELVISRDIGGADHLWLKDEADE